MNAPYYRTELDFIADEFQAEMYPQADYLDPHHWSVRDYDGEDSPAYVSLTDMLDREQSTQDSALWNEQEPKTADDDSKTRGYHAWLLNVWRDQHGLLSVGSVRIETHHDNPVAYCTRCRTTVTFEQGEDLRESMEDFTSWVIIHGNQHGPHWAKKYRIGKPWPRGYHAALPIC